MFRTRLALVALIGAALVFVASASAAVPTLTGTDGPGFTITLKKGKTKAADAIKGAVMRETKGMAKTELVQEILLEELQKADTPGQA